MANLSLQGRAEESSTCSLCEWAGDVKGVASTLIYTDKVALTLDCSQKAAIFLHIDLDKTMLMISYQYSKVSKAKKSCVEGVYMNQYQCSVSSWREPRETISDFN